MKFTRQYADDDGCIAVQRHGFSEDIGLTAITLLPGGVAQQSGAGRARQIFTWMEIAPEGRGDASVRKKPSVTRAPLAFSAPEDVLKPNAEYW